MLSASELRIGSWVLHDGLPVEVYAIDLSNKPYVRINETIATKPDIAEIFEPILITPELLETTGFTSDSEVKDRMKLQMKDCTLTYCFDEKRLYCDDYLIQNFPVAIHQLQTIVFALTGVDGQFFIPASS